MKDNRRTADTPSRPLLAVGLVLALVGGGCVSPQLLQDKDNEIATLREERTRLKKELRDRDSEIQSLELALSEAQTMPVVDVQPASHNELNELTDLGIGVDTRGTTLVLSIPAEITFPSGKAALSRQGRDALLVVANTLSRDYPEHNYWIEGHTDTDPISKANFESNRALSIARAMSVLHFLVEDAGIPDSQCVVAGHGEYRPVAANSSSTGKAQNRRVEIVVHRPDA